MTPALVHNTSTTERSLTTTPLHRPCVFWVNLYRRLLTDLCTYIHIYTHIYTQIYTEYWLRQLWGTVHGIHNFGSCQLTQHVVVWANDEKWHTVRSAHFKGLIWQTLGPAAPPGLERGSEEGDSSDQLSEQSISQQVQESSWSGCWGENSTSSLPGLFRGFVVWTLWIYLRIFHSWIRNW